MDIEKFFIIVNIFDFILLDGFIVWNKVNYKIIVKRFKMMDIKICVLIIYYFNNNKIIYFLLKVVNKFMGRELFVINFDYEYNN